MRCRHLRTFRTLAALGIFGILALTVTLLGARGVARAATPFPEPEALRHQIDFWTQVFGVYSKHQVAIHDTERLDRIYVVLDYRAEAASGMSDIGLAKLRNGGMDWLAGDILRNQVAHDNLLKIQLGDVHSPIGAWLVQFAWIFPPLAVASVFVELSAPVVLLSRR